MRFRWHIVNNFRSLMQPRMDQPDWNHAESVSRDGRDRLAVGSGPQARTGPTDLEPASRGHRKAARGNPVRTRRQEHGAEWVRRHGHPRTADQAARHAFVGSDRSGRYLAYLRQHGLPLETSNFSCYADNTMANWSLLRHGLGIGPMMEDIACNMPDVVRLLYDVPSVVFPIWLVTHRELRTARRIRLVFDMLADALSAEPAGPALADSLR